MKTLREELQDMDNEFLQMIKQLVRACEINIEILEREGGDINPLLGESLVVENFINKTEVILKERAIINIARFQPAAKDLRKLVMYIDSVRLVERMGDLLKGTIKVIREIGINNKLLTNFQKERFIPVLNEIKQVLDIYINALTTSDEKYLYMILAIDDSIDIEVEKVIKSIVTLMEENVEIIPEGTLLLLLIKKYERVSDHTTHLVHDLLYIIKGENLRKRELEKEGNR